MAFHEIQFVFSFKLPILYYKQKYAIMYFLQDNAIKHRSKFIKNFGDWLVQVRLLSTCNAIYALLKHPAFYVSKVIKHLLGNIAVEHCKFTYVVAYLDRQWKLTRIL